MPSRRGGPRPGAGRKLALPWEGFLLIGLDCQRQHHARREQGLDLEIDRKLAHVKLSADVAQMVPKHLRRRWEGYDDHREDIDGALREIARVAEDAPAPRVVIIKPRAPYGARSAIIQAVWEKWREFFPKLTKRRVEEAWDQVREWDKRSSEELEGVDDDGGLARRASQHTAEDGGSTLV